MSFIHDDFLLSTDAARQLYHEYASPQPILDYHSHLPPQDVANDRRFGNLSEIWLEGDHYKWRAMRANGADERYCTGNADPYDKFVAWARTMPQALRNPLYHWTHLELKRYFGIDQLLDETSAAAIWERAGDMLATDKFTAQGILKKFKVVVVCTTDDPVDDLAHHQAIANSECPTRIYPTFRPDKVMTVDQPIVFNDWLARLEQVTDTEINSFDQLLVALTARHEFFHSLGCRLSDHSLPHCFADFRDDRTVARIFDAARSGASASADEQRIFASHMMLFFGRLDAQRGWTKQLHIGPLRNNSSRKLREIGPDAGFDSIGDWPQATAMATFFDRLDQEDALPQTIVYNNNPKDSFVFATMLGNFQDGRIPGKMQFGSGWWHLDQKEGIESQINTLSNVGLLSRFIGMLTDSRSFMSFPRHEYFRRVLCNLLGGELERGELPPDMDMVGQMVRNICFENARQYLRIATGQTEEPSPK